MKLITRDIDYSIRVIKYLAERKNFFCVTSDVKKDLKIPDAFLKKIIRLLGQSKILISYKGKGGGIKLAKHPEKINILNVMEIFQNKFKLNECKFKGTDCPVQKKCKLKKNLENIEKIVKDKLKRINIKSII